MHFRYFSHFNGFCDTGMDRIASAVSCNAQLQSDTCQYVEVNVRFFRLSYAKRVAGSHVMELAMKLVQFIISKLPAENVYLEHPTELSKMVIICSPGYYSDVSSDDT